MKMTRWAPIAVVLVAGSGVCFGQTCTITGPASGQLILGAQPLQLTATVSSAPTAYKLIWSVDYQRWAVGFARDSHPPMNDFRDSWQGQWTVTWYTGLNGDGPHAVSGILYDIFGNTLATCPAVAFTVRVEGMSNQSLNAVPTSGKGKLGLLTFDGTNRGGSPYIDGYQLPNPGSPSCGGAGATSQTGGSQIPNFNTACFPNGTHQILYPYNLSLIADPYLFPQNFSSSNVSGNNIAIANHYSTQGGIVTFSNTGGALPAPLVPGCQFYWATSASNSNTATLSVTGGVITVNVSSACGLAPGTPVYLRNIQATSATGQANCDGYYTMATGAGTSFTVTAPPNCPNGASAADSLEVDINPYFVQYVDAGHIAVAATAGGPAITLTTNGSGTSTVLQRIRSPYWTPSGNNGEPGQGRDFAQYGGPAYIQQLVTFSNGTTPMEIEVPYWEMHLIAGASTRSTCPKIKNTDLTLTTIACNASGLTYTEVNDGVLSGVCSVDSSGNVTPIMAGWCQVQVACAACASGGMSLPPVTVYIQVHSGSITFPHFTHNGSIATAFSPGNSFFPLSAWQLTISGATAYQTNPGARTLWYGPMLQESNLNTALISPDPSGVAFGDPASTTCVSATWPSAYHAYESAFAAQYGIYFETDTESTQWGANGPGWLAAFLNNIGYNRQSCFSGWLSSLVSEGRTYRTFSYDELNQYMAGNYPFRSPNIGSTNFPSIVASSGVATYNVAETFTGVWSQSAGTGSWIKMAGAVTNTCLNGWFPVTGIATTTINGTAYPVSFTTPTTCANGTYTESTAQLYHYWAGGGIGENAGILPRLVGTGAADNPGGTTQHWDSTYFTQVVVSGGVAEFYAQAHGIANNQAVRVQGSGAGHNLNTVKPITVIDANHFSIAYNSSVEAVPSNGTYTSSTDPSLYFTVDENFPPTPFIALRNIFTSVTGHPATTWSAIGFTFAPGNPGVYNWAGNPAGEDAANDYIPQPPTPVYGPDATVWQWANYSQSSSGLATRAYQLQPRAMLWGAGPDYSQYCPSFQFNPACDRPTQLDWRPETLVAQMVAMLTLNVSALRLYNFVGNMGDLFTYDCCGWSRNGVVNTPPGTGAGKGINPFISPKQWSAMAHTNALIKLREDTELQPPANKPYMGPFFLTDAHTSATYGNELKILCASEMPYGTQTIAIPAISGGSVLKYILTGYSLSVKLLSGNPATDTDEFCSSPGRTTTYVALPATPAVNPMDHITFAPPSPLPFGASKFLLQVGYYPRAMQDDPVTDCTAGCTIGIDHHNTAAWYRVIYADSNNLPLSVGDPAQIPSQGLN
jgi:hypothetical protein